MVFICFISLVNDLSSLDVASFSKRGFNIKSANIIYDSVVD